MRLLITDVTEMHAGNYCVAGWCADENRMVRPLPNCANWTRLALHSSGVAPGATMQVEPSTKIVNSSYPHQTEDTPINPSSVKSISPGPQPWFGPNAPPAASTLAEAFKGKLGHNSVWDGVRKGVHVLSGAEVRSLWAVRVDRTRLFFQDEEFDEKRQLKAILNDGENRYKLAVSSAALKEAWRAGGVTAIHQALPKWESCTSVSAWHERGQASRSVMSWSTAFTGKRMDQQSQTTVLTIGHSTHPLERCLTLLRQAGVTAIADVRSAPYSRHAPQFNSDALKAELRAAGIAYSFLGRELGGRPRSRDLYRDAVADYEKMAATEGFQRGLDRLVEGARKYRIALMCSEQDPLDCHRSLLIGRALSQRGVTVRHLLANGQVVDHAHIEDRLLAVSGRAEDDLFASREERLAAAYGERARKVAFAESDAGAKGPVAAE